MKRLTKSKNGKFSGFIEPDGRERNYLPPDKIGVLLDRLAELEDKLESGQLVELPCKIGDTVWVIIRVCGVWDIQPGKVIAMNIFDKDIILTLSGGDVIDGNSPRIFTDKAQAEAKLKELQEKGK